MKAIFKESGTIKGVGRTVRLAIQAANESLEKDGEKLIKSAKELGGYDDFLSNYYRHRLYICDCDQELAEEFEMDGEDVSWEAYPHYVLGTAVK